MAAKANFQHLGLQQTAQSVDCYWVRNPHFGFHWHYHPELEITYVHQGHGVRLVGNNVGYFEAGDFVFLGSNLPHTWITDQDFNQKEDLMEVVVLQFLPNLLPTHMMGLSEMQGVKRLLSHAHRGVAFSEAHRREAGQRLLEIVELEGLARFTQTLHLLDFLGRAASFDLLATHAYLPTLNSVTEQRLLTVCQYIHEHFTRAIRLEEVSKLANMNASAFCRFFRKSTGQSFMEYVTDLRIGKACNLLLDHRKRSMSQVAYESGFRSQTLFNKSFLKRKGVTPTLFRDRQKGH